MESKEDQGGTGMNPYYRARRDAGLCAACGGELANDDHHVLCAACREKKNAAGAAKYWKRRAAELCVSCGAPAMPGKCRCFECARIASRDAAASARRRKTGRK